MVGKKQIKKIVLIILDGWGVRKEKEFNGIEEAKKPNFDKLWKEYPHGLLKASGLAVGLPEGQMGNSEVGHTTIGAGKVVYSDLVRIGDAIKSGSYEKNKVFKNLFAHVKKNKSKLHVMGLLGPGGVHSHSSHLYAFLEIAKKAGISDVYIHCFTDGRDTAPQSAVKYIKELEIKIKKIGIGKIATICGRYFAMDRDNNWDRLEKTTGLIFEGKGNIFEAQKASVVAEEYYKAGKTDEHFEPTLLDKEGIIEKGDGIFFYNFRADRARMISKIILEKRKKMNLFYSVMTQYDEDMKLDVVFLPIEIETTLAKEISKSGLIQAHIAETEKFAHATYFLNGGDQKTPKGERDILLDSRKDIATHDLAPEMKAKEISDATIQEIKKETDFIFVNFANPDMVGHTGNGPAIIESIEVVDKELGRIVEVAKERNVTLFITADHGNAEIYFDKKAGVKHTAHTTNPVPFIFTDKESVFKGKSLSEIASFILKYLGLKIPKPMK
jgi:2,3-bisphosphoglycerate-independent phosphoglycerate mutase